MAMHRSSISMGISPESSGSGMYDGLHSIMGLRMSNPHASSAQIMSFEMRVSSVQRRDSPGRRMADGSHSQVPSSMVAQECIITHRMDS